MIKDFLQKFNIKIESEKSLKGGTQSSVRLINSKYLIKSNSPALIKAENKFCKFYPNLFQKMIYVDPKFNYIVYEFIEGQNCKEYDEQNVTYSILNIIKSYKEFSHPGYGYLDCPVSDIESFFLSEIEEFSLLDNYLTSNDYSIVLKAINNLKNHSFKKQLIHGDLGVHNIIVKNKNFNGIIDPSPVIFDGIYDFIYYICSDIDLLKKYTIENISNLLNENITKVKELYTIILYARLLRCLKYYPEEITQHIDIWNREIKNNA